MKRTFWPGIVAYLVLTFVLFSQSVKAETKDFYFPELKADIYVQKDGSFIIDELLTFEFQGRFSWASLWIPLEARKDRRSGRVEVEDFSVMDEGGNLLPLETEIREGKFQARWSFSANNVRRTFHIYYRVKNAILNYADVSELYWQVIGSQVERPTARAEILVHLPEPVEKKEDILIYGHGPLSGRSEIVDLQKVRFIATNIPSRQFLEVKVVWPAGMVQGISATGYTREKIKEEERKYVQETIRKAMKAAEARESQRRLMKRIGLVWVLWQIIGPFLWLVIYLNLWNRIGKDYRFDDRPEYFREIPSALPPALVQVLRREGQRVQPVAFTATIFDLARKGYLEIRDEQLEKKSLFGAKIITRTIFTLKKLWIDDKQLRSYEKDCLKFLFENTAGEEIKTGASFDLEDLVAHLKKNPAQFQSWFRDWSRDIDHEAKRLEFIEPESKKAYSLLLSISLPIAIMTVSPVMLILSLALSPRMKRRKKEWARENELWKALERFLDDFSDFKEIPAEAYKLWDQYLVFAILFGKAKKLIKMLPLIIQDERAVKANWILAGYTASSLSSSLNSISSIGSIISSIERAATSISQASTSAAHYSSGGGGGFSGGGGGGGGGGGASAG